jgi:glycosyltransferase involved in cell wall biosynthesis
MSRISHVRLVVLARGADQALLAEVDRKLARYGLSGKVSVIGGWLSREQVWAHIELCDLVVLPFVIVPSDVPIAVLESMARGKPVIGSPVDGIPELIAGRGVVADPLRPASFARSIVSLANNQDERERLGGNARTFMQSYPDWDAVGARLIKEVGLA